MNPASVERKEIIGLHRITKKVLRDLCKKNQLYQTPELNEVLYLHYQGFQYIECLEEYTELKCLWLECNAISEIQGLENQPKLKCLFLQNNLIKCIENLENCRELDMLNLASNHIRKIENCGIDVLPVLNTLNLSSNCLRDSESLRGLEECKTLTVLDLANNRIDDILVVKIFAKMPQLRVLVLQGNPVVSKIPQYRKTLILECKELTYLDSRPVFPKDRACAEAWKRGGYNEERKEQERWNRRDRKKIRDSVNATIRMRNKHKPPNEQMELITSSDSETDEKRRKEAKERRASKKDPRLLIETGEDIEDEGNLLDIWDEVSGPNGVIPKVQYEEEQSDVEVNNVAENERVKVIDAPNENSNVAENEPVKVMDALNEDSNIQKLEASEGVNASNILKIVDQSENDEVEDDDVPALISDIGDTETNVLQNINRKRSLIEEIDNDAHIAGKKVFIEEFNSAESNVVAQPKEEKSSQEPINNTGAIRKRFPIEETNDKHTDFNMTPRDRNEAMSFESVDMNYETFKNPLVEKEKSAEIFKNSADQDLLLESSNVVKKPFWVEEIFNQTTNELSTKNIDVPSFEFSAFAEKEENSLQAEGKINFNAEFGFDLRGGETKVHDLQIDNIEEAAVSKDPICIEEIFDFDKALALKKPELSERKVAENVKKTTLIEDISEKPSRSIENILLEEAKEIFEKSHFLEKPTYGAIDNDLNSQTTDIRKDRVSEFLEVTENPLSFLKTIGEDTDLKSEKSTKKPLLIEEIAEPTLNIQENCITVYNIPDSNSENELAFENSEFGENIMNESEDSSKLSLMIEVVEEKPEKTTSVGLQEFKSISVAQDAKSQDFIHTEDADLSNENDIKRAFDKNNSESDISNGSDDLCSETSTDNEDSSFEKPSTSNFTSIIDPYMKINKKDDYSYKLPTSSESESEDESEKLQYNAAADAICNAVMSRVGEHEQPIIEKPIFLPPLGGIEVLPENYEPVLEMEKMLKLLPDDEAEQRAKRLETTPENTDESSFKTAEEIKYDKECEEVNRQVVEDFEALNANMEYFIEQFQQEQQQMSGELNCNIEEHLSTLSVQEDNELDPSHTTVFEKIVQTKQISLEERKAGDDVQFDVVYKEIITTETELTTESTSHLTLESINEVTEKELTIVEHEKVYDMVDNQQTEMLTVKEYHSNDVVYLSEQHENKTKEIPTLKSELTNNDELLNACGDHIGIGQAKEKLPFMELEEVLQRSTFKTYERESIELQALLKKLELQNEKLTYVKKTCDALLMTEEKHFSDEEKSEDSYHDAEDNLKNETEMVDEVITELVDNVVEKGEENELNNKMPKNYVITDLESDEEYSYSGPPKPEEPPVKSIRSVLGAFNNLIKEIARKNRDDREREMQVFESKRVPTTKAAKLSSLQTLLKTPSLLEHHKHSYEELKPKVDSIKKQNTKELKQMVERVYAQKDKYNDSLEVVDGRLVVIKKETGEVEEISEHQQQHTESDSDVSNSSTDEYETANSSNENEKEKKSKDLIWDFSMGATKPHTWIPKYRPTMRKSAEELILNVLEANETALKLNENNDEDSGDDDADGNKTLRKIDSRPSVFSNIDEEFFKNLDFKKIAEESTQDENFVEVARSYEELRQIIKQSGMETARSMVSTEEQSIIDTLEPAENINDAEDLLGKDELTQAEDLLMHKLVQRTKEAKERGEDALISEADPNDKPYLIEDTEKQNELKEEDLEAETDSIKTLLDEPVIRETQPMRNNKVVKMLKKLQTDNPIAQDILQELKTPDFGDFISPLEVNLEDENFKAAQSSYEQKFAEYQKQKLEKHLKVKCNEIAIQCEPSGFVMSKEIPYMISESAEVSVIATSKTDVQLEDSINQTVTQAVIADSLVDINIEEAFEVTEI